MTLLVNVMKHRNSDREIFWRMLEESGKIRNGYLSKQDFMESLSYESCRRSRQAIAHSHPELRGTNYKERQLKAKDPEIFVEQDGQVRGI